ncbi:hypothetical protein FNV43_RR06949 [Rhamnella rubrinervis]|uniref:Uncharacterized protein n=1 Tax=Rhamnella rubrinervis TaxID=2594499 RepID=A0A8K0MMG7_9ROSA|nr:hypothetical protein FNV43_RR06949 [Rhamnella rubrinervis]
MPSVPSSYQYTRSQNEKEGSTTTSTTICYRDDGNGHKGGSHAEAVRVDKKKEVANKAGMKKKPSMDINESAEAFIQNFRKQLLIQRLESIENYEQMLARSL